MKAIAVYQTPTFAEVDLDKPQPGPRDLLVKVEAISVNPVDYKVKRSIVDRLTTPRVLGWDAAGIVEQVGDQVSLFRPGDSVYYAGSITRPGCNSAYQLVDERIVGRKPSSLSFEAAAALPLTSLTAWEGLFERLAIGTVSSEETVLIIGGAGGVGSIAAQLAKRVAGLRTIATASRPETVTWCKQMGADHCINHHENLLAELEKIGLTSVDYIFCCNDTDRHWKSITQAIKPQGKICSIVENKQPLDQSLLKDKSATFVWEFMFTKAKYETADMQSQGEILNQVADLVDQNLLQSTMTASLGPLSVESLTAAHAQLETGRTIGKLVLSRIAKP